MQIKPELKFHLDLVRIVVARRIKTSEDWGIRKTITSHRREHEVVQIL